MKFLTLLSFSTTLAFAWPDTRGHREKRAAVCASYHTPASLARRSWDASEGCSHTYKVESGDSCYTILAKSKSSFNVGLLRLVNPSINHGCTNLEVGTSYCTALSPCTYKHALSLKKGCRGYARPSRKDTWATFHRRHKVSYATLRDLNPKAGNIQADTFYCIKSNAAAPRHKPHKTTTKTPPKPQRKVVTKGKPATEVPKKSADKPKEVSQPSQDDHAGHSSGGSSGGSGPYLAGDMTYFTPGLGSCGWTNSSDQMIAAAAASLYDQTGNDICGKWVTVEYGGKSVDVQIVDKCPPCTEGSLDLSPAAFQKLADLSIGRTQMKWSAAPLGSAAVAALGL